MIKSTDAVQFSECNAQLKEMISKNEDLKSLFTDEQLEDIDFGDTPTYYTWHHDLETGKLQLVDTVVHNATNHTGGRNIWGGGSEAR
ncbi:MAG: HNH endonuclease [Treponema sp.]|nr:HNH endonuclease [Treponema sp.]